MLGSSGNQKLRGSKEPADPPPLLGSPSGLQMFKVIENSEITLSDTSQELGKVFLFETHPERLRCQQEGQTAQPEAVGFCHLPAC